MTELIYLDITVQNASWQQHRKQLSDIRYKVFVDEQQVPIDIEIDEQDATAQHWLAYIEGKAIGTARLESDGKIGRMAVLKEFRNQGVGGALLRRIILDASCTGAKRLYLNAQLHALPFYKRFGFTDFGNEFDEAGITHIAMELDLRPYRHRARQSNAITTHLSNQAKISNAAIELTNAAQRSIRIYCQQFNNDLLADLNLLIAFRGFFQKSSKSYLQVLIQTIDGDTGRQQPLMALQRQLDSRFEIRQCGQQEKTPKPSMVALFDDQQLIQAVGNQPGTAQLLQQAAVDVRQHGELFDELWQRSPIPAELRQLSSL